MGYIPGKKQNRGIYGADTSEGTTLSERNDYELFTGKRNCGIHGEHVYFFNLRKNHENNWKHENYRDFIDGFSGDVLYPWH